MALVWATTVGAFLGVVAMVVSFRRTRGTSRPARVSVDGRRVRLERDDKVVTLTHDNVASAYSFGQCVDITAKDGDVWRVVVSDEASARAVVHALELDREGTLVTFDTASTSRVAHIVLGIASFLLAWFVTIGAVFTLVPFRYHSDQAMIALMLGATALVYSTAKKRWRGPLVTVGADGILVEGVRRELIPLDQLRTVDQPTPFAPLRLHFASGRVITFGARTDPEKRNALAMYLRALLARPTEDQRAGLARDGLTVAAWRDRLRKAIHGGGYRVAANVSVDASLAERVVAPRVAIEERVGAALALRVADPTHGASRVRIAAQACLDPRAREALEAASAEQIDDEAIERALAR